MINVCLACDDNYAKYAGVVIASILDSANPDDSLCFYILDGGIKSKNKDKILALKDIKVLAFDHNLIIKEALTYIRQFVEFNPSMLFDLLPRKFTASQLRILFELVYDKPVDVRNFHKKIAMMEYVVPLEEKQQGVAHRAARYYKFDKKIYNKTRR